MQNPVPTRRELDHEMRQQLALHPLSPILSLLPLVVGLGLLCWGMRRRQRIGADSLTILAALDAARIGELSLRDQPRSHDARQREFSLLLAQPVEDLFGQRARVRAASLAAHLPPAEAHRLAQALGAAAQPSQRATERSLLARCILELDPEQQARFAFLALEGELEAQAALAWAARLRGGRP